MNTVFFAILILLILYTNFRIGRKISKQNKAWIQQHAKLLEVINALCQLVQVYGDTAAERAADIKEDMILLLAQSQFELFQILHEAVSTEQYEAAQDIQQLINQVRQTIKTYSCR